MKPKVVLLSVPGLRKSDLSKMPFLESIMAQGSGASLRHHFPAVTWPSQSAMLTGKLPSDHGVVANGFYWRDSDKVEMWTAWNEVIEQPQIWDCLKKKDSTIRSAAWFPMLSKGCGADFVCMPAPIHNPDGSEDLWCYTKPQEFYGQLIDKHQHFPLQHFWGPLANIKSTQWIADSAVDAASEFKPDFFYIYLPHLDYAAQKSGPNSQNAFEALAQLDNTIEGLSQQFEAIYASSADTNSEITWLIVSEYVITEVDHVTYPNRLLREKGLLSVIEDDDGREIIDRENSSAWALVDHQFSHIFIRDQKNVSPVVEAFKNCNGINHVLHGANRARFGMDHERAGEVVLISEKNSWQTYYWWFNDELAPKFASTVDIHRKPGYDPVELFFDFESRTVPLDATLVKGSHGATNVTEDLGGVVICSDSKVLRESSYVDTDLFNIVTQFFD